MITLSKRQLIGIAGNRGSGKDTVAKAIDYIVNVGSYATYKSFEELLTDDNRWEDSPIIHFADTLKQVINTVFNIPINVLNDRDKKDAYVYCLDTRECVPANVAVRKQYTIYDIYDLVQHGVPNDTYHVGIFIRHLMQYIGTNVFRTRIGKNVWVDNTIYRAKRTIGCFGYCIIADVRFQNEVDAIIKNGGIVYRVIRNEKYGNADKHISEQTSQLKDCIDIDNSATLLGLYYKVYDLVKKDLI